MVANVRHSNFRIRRYLLHELRNEKTSLCRFVFVNIDRYENYVRYFSLIPGIHQHIIATAFGGFAGRTVDKWRDEHLAERDAVLRHYVTLHQEDFPEPGEKSQCKLKYLLIILCFRAQKILSSLASLGSNPLIFARNHQKLYENEN